MVARHCVITNSVITKRFGLKPCVLLTTACLIASTLVASASAEAQSPRRLTAKRPAAKKVKRKPAPPKIRLPESVRADVPVKMDVVGVSPARRSEAVRMASQIDRFVERELANQSTLPNNTVSDEVFLRRVYLDVAGRIPTLAEAKHFLSSKASSKREDLVDELLGTPDSVSHFFNYWANVLRLVDRPNNNVLGEPYLAYVKDSIRTNKPYDQWVYEMLTADGKSWENPAVGYQLRDDGMPLPYIDNTVRVFLGTQIGCAQCHDHPFDDWTQYQFYELAAFTAGVRTRIRRGDPGFKKRNPSQLLIEEAKKRFDKGRVPGYFQRIVRANTYVVSEVPRRLRLPHDYAYTDAKPREIVEPAVPWGEVPTSQQYDTPRKQFAAWLTSPENPRFGKAIANRLWKHYLGIGLIEPVDDFNQDNLCANEELMDYLADQVVQTGYDLKEFARGILYSQTYQRESSNYDITSGDLYYFEGPVVRRLTAEQIWDSMLTLAVSNPWPFQRPTAEQIAEVADIDFARNDYKDVLAKAEKFKETFFKATYRRAINKHRYKGNVLCKASELPSPSTAEHFLRQFGQGDRETIGGASEAATVPQILAMFNGPITHVMLEPGSKIVDQVLTERTTRERIDSIFLSVLSRYPSPGDRRVAANELQQANQRQAVGYGNIIWALLNTREFLFVR